METRDPGVPGPVSNSNELSGKSLEEGTTPLFPAASEDRNYTGDPGMESGDEIAVSDRLQVVELEAAVKRQRQRVVIDWQCVNPQCHVSSPSELTTARGFQCEFYGVAGDARRKRKICAKCSGETEAHSIDMSNRLRNGEVLFPLLRLPLARDVVVLDESEEELEVDSSSESEYEFDVTDFTGTTVKEKFETFIKEMVTEQFGLINQVDNAIQSIDDRLQAKDKDIEKTNKLFNDCEKEIYCLRENLYRNFRPRITQIPSVDLNELDQTEKDRQPLEEANILGPQQLYDFGDVQPIYQVSHRTIPLLLPPTGTLYRPLLAVGELAYAMRGNILNVWKCGTVVKIEGTSEEPMIKVRFDIKDSQGNLTGTQSKSLSRKHVAYSLPAEVRLSVGTRVVAVYKDQATATNESDYYSGVVAEPPKVTNKFRYLVFFDDGYASYIPHNDVRVVTHQCNDVWEDVHSNSREFIKKYLAQYPDRQLVKLNVGEIVRTEWEGKWWITQVHEVDASLVRLQFKSDGHTEFVYRGSTRLGPLFLELQQQTARKEQQSKGNVTRRLARKRGPYVEYTRLVDSLEKDTLHFAEPPVKKSVARKSTGTAKTQVNSDQVVVPKMNLESKGEIGRIDVEVAEGYSYQTHQCGTTCLENPIYQYDSNDKKLKQCHPLLIPIVLGWKRQLTKHKNLGRRTVFYIAPCGRRLRNLEEIHRYLRVTTLSKLGIDFFNLEWYVHVFNEFKPERAICKISDFSYGKENIAVSCVNSFDSTYPEYVEYSRVRLPQTDVVVNTDENFLVCCDCTDDCQNKDTCACCQLTVQSTAANHEGLIDRTAGYSFRRLKQQVQTGIFECNSRCKCQQTCLNRVAQLPLLSKLQVFKTMDRGWGLRTLTDVPVGSFICIYVGNLYSNTESNVVGQNYGDEYFADLDLIETVEKTKEGYESDCDDELNDCDDELNDCDDELNDCHDELNDCQVLSSFDERSPSTEDDEPEATFDKGDRALVLPGVVPSTDARDRQTRSRNKEESNADRGPDSVGRGLNDKRRALKDFGAMATKGPKIKMELKLTSTRKLFGKDEEVYVMDAKAKGNIGRYLNHSCDPNVFVQNCFVDTHDLRFPWLSFFASCYIKAGQELCWDYNYVVNQVEGKDLYCSCGADNCRGRLL